MKYNKKPLDFSDIVCMLKNRGLLFKDEEQAIHSLRNVSYFRLANYMRPMEQDKELHIFKPNSYFENAVSLYYFDKELRALLFEAVQTFEIALRSRFIHSASLKYGPFWFVDQSLSVKLHLFKDNLTHIDKELARSKEDFIQEHFAKYNQSAYPPAWKTLETLSFGTLSKILGNFSDTKIKKQISKDLGVPQHKFLESWVKSSVALRNCLAHHARVWNRNFPQMPQLPNKMPNEWIENTDVSMMKLYPLLCVLLYIQNQVYPENDFKTRLKTLLKSNNNVDLRAMGFPEDWDSEPLWR